MSTRSATLVPARPAPLAAARERGALARVGEVREFLGFEVSGERYGLPLASVREILKTAPLTPVPRAPGDVLGILSVRGRITTVLCLRTRLGLPQTERPKSPRILLVDRGDEILGLHVDAVTAVVRLSPSEIEPAEAIGAGLTDHVMGIGRPHGAEGDVVVLLEPRALLR